MPFPLHDPRSIPAAILLAGWLSGACGAAPPATPIAAPRPGAAAAGAAPADHTKDRKGVRHKSGSKQAVANCGPCHGSDLRGGKGPSCYTCHGQEWH